MACVLGCFSEVNVCSYVCGSCGAEVKFVLIEAVCKGTERRCLALFGLCVCWFGRSDGWLEGSVWLLQESNEESIRAPVLPRLCLGTKMF